MIGKMVSGDELAKVLSGQAERYKFQEQLQEELKAIKPGECLLYEARPEAPLWASVVLALVVDRIKGLKMIREENRVYVYKEK